MVKALRGKKDEKDREEEEEEGENEKKRRGKNCQILGSLEEEKKEGVEGFLLFLF